MADPNREAEELVRGLGSAEDALREASEALRELQEITKGLMKAGLEDPASLREIESAQRAISDADDTRKPVKSFHEDLAEMDAARKAAESAHKDLLSEAEAAREAVEAVHQFRRVQAGEHDVSRGPLTQEEAREWSRLRDERRRREGYRSA